MMEMEGKMPAGVLSKQTDSGDTTARMSQQSVLLQKVLHAHAWHTYNLHSKRIRASGTHKSCTLQLLAAVQRIPILQQAHVICGRSSIC